VEVVVVAGSIPGWVRGARRPKSLAAQREKLAVVGGFGDFFIFLFFIFIFYKNIFLFSKFTGIYPGRPAVGRPGPGHPAAGRQGLLCKNFCKNICARVPGGPVARQRGGRPWPPDCRATGHLGMRRPVLHPALAAHALLCCHLHLLATVFICSTIFDLTARWIDTFDERSVLVGLHI